MTYVLWTLMVFVSFPVYAEGAAAKSSFDFMQFLPLIAIFGIFYFLLIRPQQKKMKQHKEMLNTLRRGDQVVTAGGIIGTIDKILSEDQVQVDLGNGVMVCVVRSTIAQVLSKPVPVSAKSEEPLKERLKKSSKKSEKSSKAN